MSSVSPDTPATSNAKSIEYSESEHTETLSHCREPLEVTFDKAYENAPTKLSVVAFEKQIANHLAEPFAETDFEIDTVHEGDSHFFLTTTLHQLASYEELVGVLSTITDYAWEYPGGCWLRVRAVESNHHSHLVATIVP